MRQIQKDATNRSVDLYIIDSTDGTPETGVLWNTSGIDLKYRRDLEAAVSVTEATLAGLTTAHTDGGFLEIGNGVYRFDLPDAAWATGADHVTIFGTVTGMIVLPVTVQLVGYDPDSALATPTNITAATGVTLAAVTHTGAVIPTVTTLTGHTPQTGDSFARIGATGSGLTSLATQASVNTIDALLDTEIAAILAAVDTEVTAIKAKTDLIPAAPAAVGDVPTAVENADALLGRNISGGSSVGRTVKQALHFLRNKWSIGGGTLTVTDTDDVTTSWTATVSTTAGNPVSTVDPA